MKLRQLPLCLSFLLLLVVDIGYSLQPQVDALDNSATTPSRRHYKRAAIPDAKREPAPTSDEDKSKSGSVLTAQNFASETKTGTGWWMVEHFSPWCKHCQAFYPTWVQVVETQSSRGLVEFGQIDCTLYGDLCNAHSVKGYPQMNLYHDGEFVEQFKGARDFQRIVDFLDRLVPAPTTIEAATEEATTEEKVEETPSVPEPPKVEEPAPIQHLWPKPNTDGAVLPLTSSTFSTYLNTQHYPVFVKFFAPWCGHCKKLAPIWKELADSMRDKVTIAEVNCDDHGSLCKQEGIKGYPTLVLYTPGGDGKSIGRAEYSQGRKLEQLKDFAEKARQEPTVAVTTQAEVDEFVKNQDVVFVLLHMGSTDVAKLTPAFLPLLGNPGPVVTLPATAELYKKYGIPVTSTWTVLVFKDGDLEEDKYLSSDYVGPDHLTNFLLSHRLPLSLELNRDTFQAVMNAPHRPLVVLGAQGDKLQEIARGWKERKSLSGQDVVFAHMDTEKWGDWMYSMYGLTKTDFLERNRVVITNHQDLVFYSTSTTGNPLSLSSLPELYSALHCLRSPSCSLKKQHSESRVERIAKTLSGYLEAVESYVINYPLRFAILMIFAVLALILVLQKIGTWLGDDGRGDYEHGYHGEFKGRRVD